MAILIHVFEDGGCEDELTILDLFFIQRITGESVGYRGIFLDNLCCSPEFYFRKDGNRGILYDEISQAALDLPDGNPLLVCGHSCAE